MPTDESSAISGTLGPLLVGVILASCLYGVTSVQTYIYFIRGSVNDKKPMKCLVLFLWMLNTLRIAVVSNSAYTYMVTGFMDVAALSKPTWAIFPAVVVTVAINNAVGRVVFCYRIWRFSGKNIWLASAITVSILATMGTTLAYAIVAHGTPSWASLSKYAWLLSWGFACSITADILICASLCILLARRRTGYETSDTIVRKLTMYAVNTGLLSTICASLCLITYLAMPDNLVFIALYIVYPELVLNALLATFNGRTSLQKQGSPSPAAKHVALDKSARTRRGGMGQANDINVELGVVNISTITSQGSGVSVTELGDEAHKIPEFH